MKLINMNKKKCTGCGACAVSCPKQCIVMEEDSEGFFYPNINVEQCIHCRLCDRVCPVLNLNSLEERQIPKAFAMQAKDDDVLLHSSSGGVFTLLAQQVLSIGGVVAGAAFIDNYEVEHILIEREEQIPLLRGSKYVQSDTRAILSEVRHALHKGRTVLFCGTPCQVEGVLRLAGNERKNLITVDLLCHGVPSRKVWRKYLAYRKEKDQGTPQRISFRDKSISWKSSSMRFDYKNTTYCKKTPQDLFLCGFIRNLYLRPSCYCCPFKSLKRHSDITIGDFWGIEQFSDTFDERGTSLVFVHSEEGAALLQSVSDKMKIQAFADAEKIPNGGFSTAFYNLDRSAFFKHLDQYDFEELHRRYFSDRIDTRAKRVISRLIYKVRKGVRQ